MRKNPDKKVHYKMYKSGKLWIVAGIATTFFATNVLFNQNLVHADTSNDSLNVSQQQSSKVTNNTNPNPSTNTQTSTTNNTNTNTQANLTNPQSKDNTAGNTNQNDNPTVTNPNTNPTNPNNTGFVAVQSSSSSNSTTSSSANGSSSATSASSSSAQSSQSNSQSTSNSKTSSASQTSSQAAQTSIANSLNAIFGQPVNINGQNYYVDSNHRPYHSTLVMRNNQLYYFDQNGQLSDIQNVKPTLGLTINTGDPKLAVANPKSITNVDGFLTASSWYQPKEILDNGTTWRKSNKKDLRPLLSVWWPNKQVQVNYINFMKKLNLTNLSATMQTTQENLNAATEDIRKNMEQRISSQHSVKWLQKSMKTFITDQNEWNLTSEGYNINDGFQGGSVLYQNSKVTPYANSNWRLLNRYPANQTGQINYKHSSYNGYEFLLANDVDNSNPIVQAENLNLIYYMTHFGEIVAHNKNANFDSIRIDAVDNMDADLLNLANDYFKDAYHVDKSAQNENNHLSILEDWSKNDPYYLKDHNSQQLTIDSKFKDQIKASLWAQPNQRVSLSNVINGWVNRASDFTQNKAIPNYSMARAHDSAVQEVIAQIIQQKINPNSNGFIMTQKQLDQAFQIYDQDEKATNKQYTQYNIPSSYALMLTNKDTIPRIYYGDMFTDDGQFMANKSPYYYAIKNMLNARIKYVSGGQQMNIQKVNNGNSEVLTSVRFGKNALKPTDTGSKITRNSGIAVIESNDPNLKLTDNDQIVINMGAAHKNQLYRPLINPTDNGLANYSNDNVTNLRLKTNAQGQLILNASEIQGYSNPQLSGYLSMWVPVGASKHQDIRVQPSKSANQNGKILNSNASLDSNVFFEGFSNFQSQPTNPNQYENKILPSKVKFFKSLGVTYMQLPPQYRSVNGNSFIDATVKNGYAFNDRYDFGFKTPTKYGTTTDLAKTIEAFHQQGLKVIGDLVPDQLYSLPGQQVVNAVKVDRNGTKLGGSAIYNNLYLTHTISSKKDYQYYYGGKFLKLLKQKYPQLFKTKQISTGQVINGNVRLRQWNGKYLNGSNIQGTGAYNVLSNLNNNGYFSIAGTKNQNVKTFLPQILNGNSFKSGLYQSKTGIKYLTSSGYAGKNGFYNDQNGYAYYFDKNGNMVTTPSVINNAPHYFLNNGINLRNFIDATGNQLYYYAPNGSIEQVPGYYTIDKANYFYVDKNGQLLTGLHKVPGGFIQYFDEDGIQVKGQIKNTTGGMVYLDPNSGNVIFNQFIQYNGHTYYADKNGYLVTGKQIINGQNYTFDNTGIQTA